MAFVSVFVLFILIYCVLPNAPQTWRSAIDGRTTRHVGYRLSQRIRMHLEEIFGWIKTVGAFRKTRYRGLEKVDFAGYLVGAAYNLVRLARMVATPTAA